MRTTVTFEDDVARAIAETQKTEGIGVSAAVNKLVRAGLANPGGRRTSFVQKTSPMEARIDVANVAEVLELMEESDR
jgi:hypothetical protein